MLALQVVEEAKVEAHRGGRLEDALDDGDVAGRRLGGHGDGGVDGVWEAFVAFEALDNSVQLVRGAEVMIYANKDARRVSHVKATQEPPVDSRHDAQ